MTFEAALGKHVTIAASPNMFYMTTTYKNKTNMKVTASNVNMQIHQLLLNSGFLVSV